MIDPPKTKEAASKVSYGIGMTQRKYTPSRCAYETWGRGAWQSHQCHKQPGYGPDALYCKQHAKKVAP